MQDSSQIIDCGIALIQREGIARTLDARLLTTQAGQGRHNRFYMGCLVHLGISLDDILARPRIDNFSVSVDDDGAFVLATVPDDERWEVIAYSGRNTGGTYDHQVLIQASTRDGGVNIAFETVVASGSWERQQFGHPITLSPGWDIRVQSSSHAGTGNFELLTHYIVHKWHYYDET